MRERVIIALAEEGITNASKTELTRHIGCTRRAMHMALNSLELSGLITRKQVGQCYVINLSEVIPGLTTC